MFKEFNSANFNILVVDDLPKNVQVLGSVLRQAKYNIEFATNGKMALEWVKEKAFDLILLDVMMPDINGFQVCEQIRKIDSFNDVPIIFLTAKTDNESVIKGFEVGGQDYITKPFDSNELLSRVKLHLELKHDKQQLSKTNNRLKTILKDGNSNLLVIKDGLFNSIKQLEILINCNAINAKDLLEIENTMKDTLKNLFIQMEILRKE